MKGNLDNYGSHNLYLREGLLPFKTIEGREGAEKLAKELRHIKRLPEINLSQALSSAAQEIANEIGKSGSSDDINSAKIIGDYGFWYGELFQLIDEGSFSGDEAVQSLLLDDGIEDKTNRKALLNTNVEIAGVGCALSQTSGTVVVMLLAETFRAKADAKEVKPPSEPLPKYFAFDNWDENAVKLDCEITHQNFGDNLTIKVKQTWQMHDNTVKVTEKIIDNSSA